MEGDAIADTMAQLGLEGVRVVPRTNSVANDINEARKLLPICMFDAVKCAHGIDALRSYRREWDDKLRNYRDRPYHDWASDPADAFRTFAMGRPMERDLNDNEYEYELGGNPDSVTGYG